MLSHDGNASPTVYVSLSGGVLRARRLPGTRFSGVGHGRSSIVGLSQSSVGRMRRFLRSCVADYQHMVTLTYPYAFPSDGRTVKDNLRVFLQSASRLAKSGRLDGGNLPKEWGAFWFLEFQARGAPHFHIFCTHDLPKAWVSEKWFRIVGSEDDRHYRAGTRVERLRAGRAGTIAYAMKYAAKPEQKEVPPGYEHVGRFWGAVGARGVVAASMSYKPQAVTLQGASRLEKLKKTVQKLKETGRAVELKGPFYTRLIIPAVADQLMLVREMSIAAAMCRIEDPSTAFYYPLSEEQLNEWG